MEDKWLGKAVNYPARYAPEVLVGIPRELNRSLIGLNEDDLPFSGLDVWHAYEFSCLTEKGLPVTALLKIVYPASSNNLIESKSLKLYLNSFNMSRLGKNRAETIQNAHKIIEHDLCMLVDAPVEVYFHDESSGNQNNDFDFKSYLQLEKIIDADALSFSDFAENPALLEKGQHKQFQVYSTLLRSNCKITFQPDWGNVYISMKGNELPTYESLLKYLVSFRDEKHFHEEICESIFYHLNRIFNPEEMMVACLYTRRGGIDICPVRTNSYELLPIFLCDTEVLSAKHLRQ